MLRTWFAPLASTYRVDLIWVIIVLVVIALLLFIFKHLR